MLLNCDASIVIEDNPHWQAKMALFGGAMCALRTASIAHKRCLAFSEL